MFVLFSGAVTNSRNITLEKTISGKNKLLTKQTPEKTKSGTPEKCFFSLSKGIDKENRMYIRGEFRESLGMNFFSPFQPEREFKVYKSRKCLQIICSRVY